MKRGIRWNRGRSCLKKLLGERARWIWRGSWELGGAEHRAVVCWWRGVMRLNPCNFMDQFGKEKVPIAKLVRLMRLGLVLLWHCVGRRVGL